MLAEARDKIEGNEKAMVESYKMELEFHKTQATLVTGSLVAVIALFDLSCWPYAFGNSMRARKILPLGYFPWNSA